MTKFKCRHDKIFQNVGKRIGSVLHLQLKLLNSIKTKKKMKTKSEFFVSFSLPLLQLESKFEVNLTILKIVTTK